MGQRSPRKGGLLGISETGQALRQLSFGWVSARAVLVVNIWNISSAWATKESTLCFDVQATPSNHAFKSYSYMNASWVQDEQGLWQ